jgi:hypothetical protein
MLLWAPDGEVLAMSIAVGVIIAFVCLGLMSRWLQKDERFFTLSDKKLAEFTLDEVGYLLMYLVTYFGISAFTFGVVYLGAKWFGLT